MISETFSKLKTAFSFTAGNTRKRRASRDSENINDGVNDHQSPDTDTPSKILRLDTPLQPLAEQASSNWLFDWAKNNSFYVMSKFGKGRKVEAQEATKLPITSDDTPPLEITLDDEIQPGPIIRHKIRGSQPALTRPSLNRQTDDGDVVHLGTFKPSQCSTIAKPTFKKDQEDQGSFTKKPVPVVTSRKERRKMVSGVSKRNLHRQDFPYHIRPPSIHDKLYGGLDGGHDSVRLNERDAYQKMLAQYVPATRSSGTLSPFYDTKFFESKKSRVVNKETLEQTYAELLKHRITANRSCVTLPAVSPTRDATNEVQWVRTVQKTSEVIERSPPLETLPRWPLTASTSGRSLSSFTNRRPPITFRSSRPSKTTEPEVVALDDGDENGHATPEPSTLSQKHLDVSVIGMANCKYLDVKWLSTLKNHNQERDKLRDVQIQMEEANQKAITEKRMQELDARMQRLLNNENALIVEEEDEVEPLPELTAEMNAKIDKALKPNPPNEILVDAFNLSIRRRDIETLAGLNWLNDEVMNFYFTMLMERGKLDNFPSVYVQNTFFYPKLLKGGHDALKRWTRKVDIFGHAMMLVPVHLGMHWCLAVVDFRHKRIRYFDSMGGSNGECLKALRNYIEKESLDKKKTALDTSEWTFESIKDVPQQLNGSDCGMFTCKYAEYLSRDKKITFTQDDMPYFRRRMVYEIITKQLL